MIMVDLFCPECDHEIIDAMIDTSKPIQECPECGCTHMKKSIGPVSFKLIYDNRTDMCDWDGNTSQYWNDVKAGKGDEPSNDKQYKWE